MFFSDQYKPSFSTLLADAQGACGKSDEQIAIELGFSRASVFTAIKSGAMKFPVGKLTLLASALNASPSQLLESLLRDTSPELLETVRKIWGPTGLTRTEQKVLEAYRTLSGGRDVEPIIMDGKQILALITA
jgi:hypothetical protein